jgi:hypothetical protein
MWAAKLRFSAVAVAKLKFCNSLCINKVLTIGSSSDKKSPRQSRGVLKISP